MADRMAGAAVAVAGRRPRWRGLRGGGFGAAGGGGGADGRKPEDVQRMRNALRDEMQAPEHLIITQSDATVIMTAGDGRTTRLSTDGRKIKDESTKVERKTKWDGGKLVSEINGLGRGKITETYSVDAERKQLHVTPADRRSAAQDDGQPRVRRRSEVAPGGRAPDPVVDVIRLSSSSLRRCPLCLRRLLYQRACSSRSCRCPPSPRRWRRHHRRRA